MGGTQQSVLPGPQGDASTRYSLNITDLEKQSDDIIPKQSSGKKKKITVSFCLFVFGGRQRASTNKGQKESERKRGS